jgi:pimeloyl-ACP methyl ester carboxylesterase
MMREGKICALGPSGFHRVAYTEWGNSSNERVLVCVHGLTRNGRDFDFLARALEAELHIFCPDVAGRGASDWLTDKQGYYYPQYLADMTTLIARTGADRVDWVGTSMGGIIGMMLAAQPGAPIRRLLLNDVGSFIPRTALERIASYVGNDPEFSDLAAVEAYLRTISAGFGPLTDDQWRHLALHSFRMNAKGKLRFRYDPAIGDPFKKSPLDDVDLSEIWGRVQCPVMILRGAQSDLLFSDTVRRMQAAKPTTRSVEIEAVGHAPALMDPGQIKLVRDFLLSGA